MKDFISAAEAAKIIGVKESRVRQLLRAGDLPGVRTETPRGPVWQVKRRDAERFERRKPGRQPVSS